MAFWNWFSKQPSYIALYDKIWFDSEAALVGFTAAIAKELEAGSIVIAVTHFADRSEELRRVLDLRADEYRLIDQPLSAATLHGEATKLRESLLVVSAELLVANENEPLLRDDTMRVAIIVREHHPLRMSDERIEHFAACVPYITTLEFHVALDDAAMQVFASDWVRNLLKRLGMQRNECIESRMVSRRIREAQRKNKELADRLKTEQSAARSAAEWVETNLSKTMNI
jgi:preprotein translocase subunit SecA